MDLDFIDLGYELSEQYTVMIVPAKWQTADANHKISSKMSYGQFTGKPDIILRKGFKNGNRQFRISKSTRKFMCQCL